MNASQIRKHTLRGGITVAMLGIELASCASPVSKPGPVTDLSATAVNRQVRLVWSASSGATSYIVYDSMVSEGPYAKVDVAPSAGYNVTSLSNTGVTYSVHCDSKLFWIAAIGTLGKIARCL